MEEKKETTTPNAALTPEQLVEKHIADRKHIITEDEMKNLKVGDDAEDADELKREIDEKEAEDNTQHHENNSYDILDA